MSKAAKCDKCGAFFDSGGAHMNFRGWPIGGGLRAGWYPKEIDLCQSCAESLRKALIAWWEGRNAVIGKTIVRPVYSIDEDQPS